MGKRSRRTVHSNALPAPSFQENKQKSEQKLSLSGNELKIH